MECFRRTRQLHLRIPPAAVSSSVAPKNRGATKAFQTFPTHTGKWMIVPEGGAVDKERDVVRDHLHLLSGVICGETAFVVEATCQRVAIMVRQSY